MKRVSFPVAKALKEAGYPQGISDYQYTINGEERHYVNGYYSPTIIDAPYYFEVWNWLWTEKEIKTTICSCFYPRGAEAKIVIKDDEFDEHHNIVRKSPEEAIIKAIEYLVKQNLIK